MTFSTVGDIAAACAGTLYEVSPDVPIHAISTDTRNLNPGDVFVAIRGENFDGHDFADQAIAANASVVISDHVINGIPCIVVANTISAYADLARVHLHKVRERRPLKVIGITGSSGKTSTKDLITDVLTSEGTVVSPPGSFNNEIGLPATVLRADEATTHLVLEMGMRGSGHIAYLCRIAAPDVSVLINIGSAHLGEVGSREGIAAAKSEILTHMHPGGIAILNADDQLVMGLRDLVNGTVLTFGEDIDSDVRISNVDIDHQARAAFDLTYEGQTQRVHLGLYGEHQVYNAAAAAAVGIACGVPLNRIVMALDHARPRSKWRMEVSRTADGVTVINDAYNANPESMRAALKSLVAMAKGATPARTWAVLGEMRELGAEAVAAHDEIGRLAVRLDVSRLIAVGEGARPIHMGAAHEGSWGNESAWVPDVDAALKVLSDELTTGDIVLVKASRSIGLERVATTLLAQRGTVDTP